MNLASANSAYRPTGIVLLAILFIVGVLASGLSALSLLVPGSFLDPMWRLNPRAHGVFSHLGLWGPILLLIVCLSCGAAAYGLLGGRVWGLRLGVGLLVLNLAGDLLNSVSGVEPRALVGVPVVGLILWYLSSRRVREHFNLSRGAT
jgi:hypothetical protein